MEITSTESLFRYVEQLETTLTSGTFKMQLAVFEDIIKTQSGNKMGNGNAKYNSISTDGDFYNSIEWKKEGDHIIISAAEEPSAKSLREKLVEA